MAKPRADIDRIVEELATGYYRPFSVQREGQVYEFKGHIFYSDINRRVPSWAFREVVQQLESRGYLIHS